MTFRPPQRVPDGMATWLRQLFSELPYVDAAYLAEMHPSDDEQKVTLLIAVEVASVDVERAGRTISTKLPPRCECLQIAVDLVPYDPRGAQPDWMQELGVEPIYERAL
jgi:hypothetical protein